MHSCVRTIQSISYGMTAFLPLALNITPLILLITFSTFPVTPYHSLGLLNPKPFPSFFYFQTHEAAINYYVSVVGYHTAKTASHIYAHICCDTAADLRILKGTSCSVSICCAIDCHVPAAAAAARAGTVLHMLKHELCLSAFPQINH